MAGFGADNWRLLQEMGCYIHLMESDQTTPAQVGDEAADEWLGGKAAAAILCVHAETLRQMHERGDLASVAVRRTPGGQRRYNKADIEQVARESRGQAKVVSKVNSGRGKIEGLQKVTCPKMAEAGHDETCKLCEGTGLCWRRRLSVPGQAMRQRTAVGVITGWPSWLALAVLIAFSPIPGWIPIALLVVAVLDGLHSSIVIIASADSGRVMRAMREMSNVFTILVGALMITPFVFLNIDEKWALVPALIAVGKMLLGAVVARTRPPYDAAVIDRYAPWTAEQPRGQDVKWQRAS